MAKQNAADAAGHPWVRLVVGRRGSGKSWSMLRIMEAWQALDREERPGRIHAVDPVATDPPGPDHVAFYADTWSPVMVEELPPGTALLVLDEADTTIGQRADHQSKAVVDIVRRGRHRGVSLLLGTQRPALLLYDVWALVGELMICHTTSKRDLDRLEELDESLAELREHIAAPGQLGVRVVWHHQLGVHRIGGPGK
jgi:hypothetical protein